MVTEAQSVQERLHLLTEHVVSKDRPLTDTVSEDTVRTSTDKLFDVRETTTGNARSLEG